MPRPRITPRVLASDAPTTAPRGRGASPPREPRRLGTNSLVLIGVSVAALAGCAKIGEDVFDHESDPFDHPIRDWALAHRSPPLTAAFEVATWAGSPSVVVPGAVLAALWLWRAERLPIAGAMVVAPALAAGLFNATKRVYARPRPPGGAFLPQKTWSFPSGHATVSAAVFGALGYVLWREKLLSGPAATALTTVPPVVVGASRVYLDVHWATDVVGGWSLGGLVAALAGAVYDHVRRVTKVEGEPVRA